MSSENETAAQQATSNDEVADAPAAQRELTDKEKLVIKLLADIGRLNNQVSFLSRQALADKDLFEERLGYIEACLGAMFHNLGIEPPVRMPKLRDAQVELLSDAEKPADEALEFKGSYSAKPHPVLGSYQVIIGVGEEAKLSSHTSMHPIVARRIEEAFATRAQSEAGVVDGEFYWIRLGLIHDRPINEDSRPLPPVAVADVTAAEEPAAT